ncbi:hypothetical protein ONZ45_g14783 [Pleurotus djamor]|nr:hypothetical protein ONZ45_g14783 [Pleurotus djamor]
MEDAEGGMLGYSTIPAEYENNPANDGAVGPLPTKLGTGSVSATPSKVDAPALATTSMIPPQKPTPAKDVHATGIPVLKNQEMIRSASLASFKVNPALIKQPSGSVTLLIAVWTTSPLVKQVE